MSDSGPVFPVLKRVWDAFTSITRMRKQEAVFYQQMVRYSEEVGIGEPAWQSKR